MCDQEIKEKNFLCLDTVQKKPIELIHTIFADGSSQTHTVGKDTSSVFMDDFLKICWMYFLKKKNQRYLRPSRSL
jgi:hypothetical protein